MAILCLLEKKANKLIMGENVISLAVTVLACAWKKFLMAEKATVNIAPELSRLLMNDSANQINLSDDVTVIWPIRREGEI